MLFKKIVAVHTHKYTLQANEELQSCGYIYLQLGFKGLITAVFTTRCTTCDRSCRPNLWSPNILIHPSGTMPLIWCKFSNNDFFNNELRSLSKNEEFVNEELKDLLFAEMSRYIRLFEAVEHIQSLGKADSWRDVHCLGTIVEAVKTFNVTLIFWRQGRWCSLSCSWHSCEQSCILTQCWQLILRLSKLLVFIRQLHSRLLLLALVRNASTVY